VIVMLANYRPCSTALKFNTITKVNIMETKDMIGIASVAVAKNMPTVGGVIKLAVIDQKGFRFLSGDEIIPPV